jgi:hypothetical protein
LSTLRSLFLANCLRHPDANPRPWPDIGGELRVGEPRYAEETADDDEKTHGY